MKLKRLLLILGATVSFAAAATPLPSLPDGPLYLKFDNREQIATQGTTGFAYAPDEINWGLLTIATANPGKVTGINTIETTGSAFFSNLAPSGQITGMFYGIEGLPSGTGENLFPATSGFLDIYFRDTDALGITDLASTGFGVRTGLSTATGFTEGILLAHLAFASGINDLDSSVFINGSLIPTAGSGFAGLATSYANIIPTTGLWDTALNSDWFTTSFGTRDVRFRNIYEELPSWSNLSGCETTEGNCIIGARSTDPATAFAIPEPGSLALLGLGLLGLAASRRRRNS